MIHKMTFFIAISLPATPRPIKACGPDDTVGSEVLIALDVSHIGMEIKPGPVEVSFLLRAVFGHHCDFAGCIMRDASNAVTAAAETPVALDSA